MRLDVQDPSSLPWLSHFGGHATPSFLLFDASDAEVWRSVGPIEAERVAETLANP